MWKVSQNPSNPDFETCKICSTKYPECLTCKKYGRTKHQNDVEKEKGAHDNSGDANKEQKDTRSKIW